MGMGWLIKFGTCVACFAYVTCCCGCGWYCTKSCEGGTEAVLNLEGIFVVEEDFCGTYWLPGGTIISYWDLGAYADVDVDVGTGAGAAAAAVAVALKA